MTPSSPISPSPSPSPWVANQFGQGPFPVPPSSRQIYHEFFVGSWFKAMIVL
ncbi:hypothetical protein PVK06_038171 [Gossypium arboreum]|uniref:Uncharacterized protein n=1 Tax=Gossypium arboreum TaxID=29729 RepID=A0ABR0MZZ2_GOSAR|nr:hypothetical protein PVK06_038171 [Gossypium arboreum]